MDIEWDNAIVEEVLAELVTMTESALIQSLGEDPAGFLSDADVEGSKPGKETVPQSCKPVASPDYVRPPGGSASEGDANVDAVQPSAPVSSPSRELLQESSSSQGDDESMQLPRTPGASPSIDPPNESSSSQGDDEVMQLPRTPGSSPSRDPPNNAVPDLSKPVAGTSKEVVCVDQLIDIASESDTERSDEDDVENSAMSEPEPEYECESPDAQESDASDSSHNSESELNFPKTLVRKGNKKQKVELVRTWTTKISGYKKRACLGDPPGYVGRCTVEDPQSNFCLEFLDESMADVITNTNENLRAKNLRPVTEDEMYAFIGALIVMGFNSQPEISSYFSRDEVLGNIAVQKAFSRTRFNELWTKLSYTRQFESVAVMRKAEKLDPVIKVRAWLAAINTRFRAVRNPRRELCVDETMTAYKGRSIIKVRMPKKPISCGFEHFTLTEAMSGYVLNDETHVGRAVKLVFEGEPDPEFTGNFLGRVTRHVARHYLGKWHHLVFDNRFTSAELLEFLFKEHKTTAVGSLRQNAAQMPQKFGELCKAKVRPKQRGTHKMYQNGRLTLVGWRDTNTLCVLSTGENPKGRSAKVSRRLRNTRISLNCPPPVLDYQKHYKGVDIANQLSTSYRVGRRCMRWHRYFFFHKLNQVLVNAYLNWKEVQTRWNTNFKKPRSQLEFRVAVARQLIGRHISRHNTQARQVPMVGRIHKLETGSKSRRCVECSKQKIRHESRKRCVVCKVHLCDPKHNRTCLTKHREQFE